MWPASPQSHDALGNLDAGSGDVRALVDIGDFVNRAAMDTDSDPQFRMILKGFADFEGTQHWLFDARCEKPRPFRRR